MQVKATKLGYYEHKRRREGDVFALNKASDFSSKWMEKLDESKASKSVSSKQKPTQNDEPKTLREAQEMSTKKTKSAVDLDVI